MQSEKFLFKENQRISATHGVFDALEINEDSFFFATITNDKTFPGNVNEHTFPGSGNRAPIHLKQ